MIISMTNNKGGTGKTTSTINLATALAQMGKRVLVVDLDPQGSTTVGFGFEKAKLLYTIYDVFAQSKELEEVMLGTRIENLTLVPSNLDLAGAEVELSSMPGREFILREALNSVSGKYDMIILDCPPNIGLLTLNAMVASNLLIIPVQCEYFPMEGLPTLLRVISMINSRLKTNFDHRILMTMYDRRTALSKRVHQELRDRFSHRVLHAVIPRTVRMAEAPSKGVPGIVYSPRVAASQQYRELAKELLEVPVLAQAA